MKRFFSTLGFLIFLLPASAQTFEWAKQIGNTGNDEGYAIKTDAAGNVYCSGSFQGTVDFDTGPGTYTLVSSGGADVFVTKMDAAGHLLWARQWGGGGNDVGHSIALDVSGNVYIAGYFAQVVDFDPGPGTFTLSSGISLNDVFISKLDAAGNFVWAEAFGGSGVDEAYAIALDNSGNIYTTGRFDGIADFDPGSGTFTLSSGGTGNDDIFISKLDAAGNFVWARQCSGPGYGCGTSITSDSQGNVYTTGYFGLICDFDPGPGMFSLISDTVAYTDGFLLKLDAAGNFAWVVQFGGPNFDAASDVRIDASGNIYTTGTFSGIIDFNPGAATYTLSAAGAFDGFISKLDAAGNFVWVKQVSGPGNETTNNLALDAMGNIYTTGSFGSGADLDPGPGTFTLSANSTNSNTIKNVYFSKLDPSGNFVWAESISTGTFLSAADLCVDGSGNIYTIGFFLGLGDFDPGSATYTLNAPSQTGLYDIFIEKLSCKPIVSVNSGSVCAGQSFTILPSGAATYTISGGSSVVSPLANSTYSIIGTSSDGCVSSNTAISTVVIYSNAIVSVNSGSICSGQSFTITPSGAASYTISGGNSVVNPVITTTYSVSGTSSAGCVSSNTAISSVSVYALPSLTVASSANPICLGETASLTAGGASSYLWDIGDNTAMVIVSPTASASYSISGTSTEGCESAAVVTLFVDACAGISQITNSEYTAARVYPNPSTGTFIVELDKEKELSVYDALGKVVFHTRFDKGRNKIDLSSKPAGIYFVKVGPAILKIAKE